MNKYIKALIANYKKAFAFQLEILNQLDFFKNAIEIEPDSELKDKLKKIIAQGQQIISTKNNIHFVRKRIRRF